MAADKKPDNGFPKAPWIRSDDGPKINHGASLPQTIAHRGYKAKFPENTMSAFTHAVNVGSHGLETDLHLSKDGVVVLSHDPSLKRCFGVKKKVVDCDWKYLRSLRTLQAPHVPMPSLVELLEYLAAPENTGIWVLLDIKLGNDKTQIIKRIADAIQSVPSPHQPWNERIMLGCWTSDYLPLCNKYLPSFPIAIITFSIKYARLFIGMPNISININQKVLMGPGGKKLLADLKRANQPVFAWTVNEESLMRWSIEKGVDGVFTDDPELFRRVCEEWEAEGDELKVGKARVVRMTFGQKVNVFVIAAGAYLVSGLLMLAFRGRIQRFAKGRKSLGHDD